MTHPASSGQEFFVVSWEKFHLDCQKLAAHLRSLQPWEGVIAVARGGLVPAAILAHELNIRLVDSVTIVSYDDETCEKGNLQILKGIEEGDGRTWLIVDDLVDTGSTARALKKMLPSAHLATVYAKPAGLSLADSHVQEVPQGVWIVFPWEHQPETAEH